MRVAISSISIVLAAGLWASAAVAEDSCAEFLAPKTTATVGTRTITPEDLTKLRDFGYGIGNLDQQDLFEIAPDGRRIALQIRRGDPVANRTCTALVVIDLDGGSAPEIVDTGDGFTSLKYDHQGWQEYDNGFPMVVSPRWAPNGRKLAHLKTTKGLTELWITDLESGATQKISQAPTDVHEFAWKSDGSGLVYSSYPEVLSEQRAIDLEGLAGYHYDRRVNPLRTAKPFPNRASREVYTVGLEGGLAMQASDQDVALLPAVTPAGQRPAVAYLARDRSGEEAWIAPNRNPENVNSASALHYRDASGATLTCTAEACAEGLVGVWFRGPGAIRFLHREGWASSQLAMYLWEPARNKVVRLFTTADVLVGCKSLGDELICGLEGSTSPRKLVRLDPDSGKFRVLYDPNPEFQQITLGQVRRLEWRGSNGSEVMGDLILPPGARPKQRHPLVVVQYQTRGFLRGGTGDEYPIQALAARGFAVLSFEKPKSVAQARNVKTSAEYTRENMLGWADRWNIQNALAAGIEGLIKEGVIDPAKVGITGFSDGSTTAQFALINSKFFSAAAISACCYEPVTTMTVVGSAWAANARGWGWPGLAAPNAAFWSSMSLAANAKSINTPILMQLPDNEYLAGLESYAALEELGKPVEMYVFPEEYHGKWQPAHRLAVYKRAIDWFDFWLNGNEGADPDRQAEYARWRQLRSNTQGQNHRPG